jgi:hypothetical protein
MMELYRIKNKDLYKSNENYGIIKLTYDYNLTITKRAIIIAEPPYIYIINRKTKYKFKIKTPYTVVLRDLFSFKKNLFCCRHSNEIYNF